MEEEGRGKREDGRGKMEDGRGKMEEGRWKREDGRGKRKKKRSSGVEYLISVRGCMGIERRWHHWIRRQHDGVLGLGK